MGRVSDHREALIAEALGDFQKLFDRIDAVTPTLTKTRDDLEFTAAALQSNVRPFQERIVKMTLEHQDAAIEHISQKAVLVARRVFDEQTRAMQEAARTVFNKEVTPQLRWLATELLQAIRQAHRPWDTWLTHAATAIVSIAIAVPLGVHVAQASADAKKAAASAASPGCAEPAPPPEKAHARK